MQFWESEEEMNRDINIRFVNSVVPLVLVFLQGVDTKDIRGISKMAEWRARWVSSKKTGNPVFPGDSGLWDCNKLSLAYWSAVLDSVYEDPDCPDDSTIEDDELFDAWLDSRNRKREQEQKKAKFAGLRDRGSDSSNQPGPVTQDHAFTFRR